MPESKDLKQAIEDAQRLVQYASIQGMELDPEIVRKVVKAQALYGKDLNDQETFAQQEEFWTALAQLSILTKPATADSVRHAATTRPRIWAPFWTMVCRKVLRIDLHVEACKSAADAAVLWARFWALLGLVIVAGGQSYYEVGQRTVAQYAKAFAEVSKSSEKKNELEKRRKEVTASEGRQGTSQIDEELSDLRWRIGEASEQTSRGQHWMKVMLFWHDWPAVAADDDQGLSVQSQRLLGYLEGWLELLRNFVLPIAWGFLGSALYVSRALAEDIRGMAYAPERAILHRSRYYMGMVAGFVAAKFFPTAVGADFGEVAPFAVALLVGYSVEVLFSMLDRLIAAFSTK